MSQVKWRRIYECGSWKQPGKSCAGTYQLTFFLQQRHSFTRRSRHSHSNITGQANKILPHWKTPAHQVYQLTWTDLKLEFSSLPKGSLCSTLFYLTLQLSIVNRKKEKKKQTLDFSMTLQKTINLFMLFSTIKCCISLVKQCGAFKCPTGIHLKHIQWEEA